MEVLQKILSFLVVLGVLVVFHELGHYLVARWCNVKVLRFSVGFGSVVWSRRYGRDGTEFAVSAVPLGGYVKMADERDPDIAPQDRARAFNRASVWQRIAIVSAGPIANLLLAIVLYAGTFMAGVPGQKPILAEPAHEGAVDLDLVEGKSLQVAQRAVARSEVVHRDPHTEIPQGMQRRHVGLARGEKHRFGHLQFEAVRSEPGQRERLAHRGDQTGITELHR